MAQIIKFFKMLFNQYTQAYKDLNNMDIFIIPSAYSYAVIYLSPEINSITKNTDHTCFANNNQ
jgi:hypothetical protein